MTISGALVVPLALALDGAFGDPPNRFHPVAWLGRLVNALMRLAPRTGTVRQLSFGTALALGLAALAAALGVALEGLLAPRPPFVRVLVSALVLDMAFALRGLGLAAKAVTDALGAEDLAHARSDLAALCSRDASTLDASALASGTIASVAENANDSVVAPLFYYALFGLPGALVFRTLNTLDAMLGYRDHREYLGKASARLDDLAGYVPARITAVLLLVAGLLVRADAKSGVETWSRDHAKTPSPNGGHPMSVMAGLLGVSLVKEGVYTLGHGRRPAREDVDRAFRVVVVASSLFGALLGVLGWVTP